MTVGHTHNWVECTLFTDSTTPSAVLSSIMLLVCLYLIFKLTQYSQRQHKESFFSTTLSDAIRQAENAASESRIIPMYFHLLQLLVLDYFILFFYSLSLLLDRPTVWGAVLRVVHHALEHFITLTLIICIFTFNVEEVGIRRSTRVALPFSLLLALSEAIVEAASTTATPRLIYYLVFYIVYALAMLVVLVGPAVLRGAGRRSGFQPRQSILVLCTVQLIVFTMGVVTIAVQLTNNPGRGDCWNFLGDLTFELTYGPAVFFTLRYDSKLIDLAYLNLLRETNPLLGGRTARREHQQQQQGAGTSSSDNTHMVSWGDATSLVFDFDQGMSQAQFDEASEELRAQLRTRKITVLRVDDLLVHEHIGQGAYAVVMRAEWNGTEMALKQFEVDKGGVLEDSLLRMYRDELTLLNRARHPNVVMFYGALVNLPYLGIGMELCLCSLETAIHRRAGLGTTLYDQLPVYNWSFVFSAAKGIARGMAYLHSLGMLHRDLKASNVLVDARGACKLADFSMASVAPPLDEDGMPLMAHTHNGKDKAVNKHGSGVQAHGGDDEALRDKDEDRACGTAVYMAPEVVRGSECTRPSDVYAFGILLNELVTRRPPHQELDEAQVIQVMMQGSATLRPRLPLISPECCPMSVVHLIQACWSELPQERPTFGEIVTQLQAIERSADVQHLVGLPLDVEA